MMNDKEKKLLKDLLIIKSDIMNIIRSIDEGKKAMAYSGLGEVISKIYYEIRKDYDLELIDILDREIAKEQFLFHKNINEKKKNLSPKVTESGKIL